MTTEVIEGEAVEVESVRAAVVQQPGQALVTATDHPEGPQRMLGQATHIATALADMVERQQLYTVIQGKKYPQVEAWMTIGRMDNVVAREASKPVQNDDGSWEAEVELIRLSDGMKVGDGSAMCGSAGDRPWDSRPAHQRRSMAVTRATSRAFRQQYSWIMALAGYEPTPADEMPGNDRDEHPSAPTRTDPSGVIGKVVAQGNQDFGLREAPDGATLPFRLKDGNQTQIVLAHDDIARTLAALSDSVLGQRATVWGHYTSESFDKGHETITYTVLHVERIQTPDFTLPAPDGAPAEAATAPMFDADEQARIDDALAATA